MIKTAVFPVGGLGTRFLPATKALPKEMLPIVDKPLIQYAVEEARAAGIETMVFVTGRQKHAIENHFDHMLELEMTLAERGKLSAVELVNAPLLDPGSILFTRQLKPAGLGHAVWCARKVTRNEPFAVILADDLILGGRGCLKEMIEAYNSKPGNYLAAMDVPSEATQSYGVVAPKDDADLSSNIIQIKDMVEKPDPSLAPSRTAVIGRYILQPSVMDRLENLPTGVGGEIQLTDAIRLDLQQNDTFALKFSGTRFDCGSKKGFVDATNAVAESMWGEPAKS